MNHRLFDTDIWSRGSFISYLYLAFPLLYSSPLFSPQNWYYHAGQFLNLRGSSGVALSSGTKQEFRTTVSNFISSPVNQSPRPLDKRGVGVNAAKARAKPGAGQAFTSTWKEWDALLKGTLQGSYPWRKGYYVLSIISIFSRLLVCRQLLLWPLWSTEIIFQTVKHSIKLTLLIYILLYILFISLQILLAVLRATRM